VTICSRSCATVVNAGIRLAALTAFPIETSGLPKRRMAHQPSPARQKAAEGRGIHDALEKTLVAVYGAIAIGGMLNNMQQQSEKHPTQARRKAC